MGRARLAAHLSPPGPGPPTPAPGTRTPGLPAAAPSAAGPARKLSYKERREFEELPGRIEALEAEQRALGSAIADPAFYTEPPDAIRAALERAEQIERELHELYARWDALDSRPT